MCSFAFGTYYLAASGSTTFHCSRNCDMLEHVFLVGIDERCDEFPRTVSFVFVVSQRSTKLAMISC